MSSTISSRPVLPKRSSTTPPDIGEFDPGRVLLVLRRRQRLALLVAALVLGFGSVSTALQRLTSPVFQGSFQLLVTDPINKEPSKAEGDASLQDVAISRSGDVDTPVLNQVLRSSMLLDPIARRNAIDAGQLGGNLTVVDAVRNTPGVFLVTLRWPDPVEGERVLKELAQEYLAYSLRQRQEKLRQGLLFLDEQAPALQKRVNEEDQRLAAFRKRNSFLEPSSNATALQQQRLALRESLQALVQKQAQLENLVAAVKAGRSVGQQFQIQGSSGEASAQLRQQLTEVEQQLAEARASYRSITPLVGNLQRRRDELATLLRRRELDVLLTQLGDNQAQQREVRRQEQRLSRQFAQNPQLIKEYDAIQQRLSVAKDNLSAYIKARENFRLEVAQRTVPWQVIVPPSFQAQPVEPNLRRSLLIWLLLAVACGVGVAFLRDRLDHVFHSPHELEEELDPPLLGQIPHIPMTAQQTVKEAMAGLEPGHRFALRESLHNLFTSFRLLRADKPLRLILLTSSAQAEGKTTASALFAQTLADLGQRVLVVDADLRRPRLHRKLGLDNMAGFSNLLTATQLADREALTAMIQPVSEHLHLLTAGPTPPDAAKLLSSDRCRQLCELIRGLTDYDVVLFDSPPTLDLSDPVLLSEHLDGLLFLVGMRQIDRSLPELALRRIRSGGVDVLGMVANQVVAPPAYGYGYTYGYGYGYGYGPKHYQSLSNRYLERGGESENALVEETSSRRPTRGKRPPSLRRRLRTAVQWLDRGAWK